MLRSALLLSLPCFASCKPSFGGAKPWDSYSGPYPGAQDDACDWHTTRESVRFCLRSGDMVSEIVRSRGTLTECEWLLRAWKTLRIGQQAVFVDAGANIGACTILLATHGARTISFEPSPSNLFYFTSTVLEQPEEVQRRITVFPYGLGDKTGRHVLYAQPGNQGNSVVDKVTPDAPAHYEAMARSQYEIHVTTLDRVLYFEARFRQLEVALMKVDVQGYEVRLLQGAHRLLSGRFVKNIKVECSDKWLKNQGATPRQLCAQLEFYNFSLASNHQESGVTLDICEFGGDIEIHGTLRL
jgi:FkbM family methyltransferase